MRINEIETLSGLERSTIRFYEREGLITPERMENGYRDYSEEDLQILLRIKLLRSLHISLEEIKELIEKTKNLTDTLSEQIVRLEKEKYDVSYAQEMCRAMREDKVSFENLDAEKYLDDINKSTIKTGSSYFTVKGDELPQVFKPWPRYLARMLDLSLYNLLWIAFIAFVFNVNVVSRSYFGNILDSFIAVAIMLFAEPFLLTLFGTTPGKAIFGLNIEHHSGGFLSYGEAFDRTWGVISEGMGYNIPIYSCVRLWKSYNLCKEKELQYWDESISYTIKDMKWYRTVLYIGSCLVLLFLLVTIILAQRIPPNRGKLTVAEFVENHNYYSKLYGIDFGIYSLDSDGRWIEDEYSEKVHYGTIPIQNPEFNFILEEGYVIGVSYTIKNNAEILVADDYNLYMLLVSLSYVCAQNEMGLFSNIPSRIEDQIYSYCFEDFDFTEAGILLTCDVDYDGYYYPPTDFMFAEENSTNHYFSLEFSANKK